MRRRYLSRVRTWVFVANTAMAVALGAFIGIAVATQLAPSSPRDEENSPPGPVQRLDFAAGVASAAPTGDAIFVKTATGATLFDLDGQVLSRYEGFVATSVWLADGSGVLMRAPEGDARGTPLSDLPVVVLEPDGKVTRLAVDASEAAVTSAFLSPDGRWIAFALDRATSADRDGGEARRLTDEETRFMLLGWDDRGRILVREPTGLVAITVDGIRDPIALPLSAGAATLARVRGGDPGSVVLRNANGLWRLGRTLEPLPAECLPMWVRPREVLCAGSGPAFAIDATSGARRTLAAIVDDLVRSGIRAASEDMLVWVDRASTVHALDLMSGVDRVLQGAPPDARYEPLPARKFLANDLHDTYFVDTRGN